MNSQNFLVLERWIEVTVEKSFSQEESLLAQYLFSETIKKYYTSSITDEFYKTIAAASIVLATKLLEDDGNYFTVCEMECICPPYPPFLDSSSIIEAEKIILENFDYNLVNATIKCFNLNSRLRVHNEILSR